MAVQGIFKRNMNYVAVRPIRLSTSMQILPGFVITPELIKQFQLRTWFRRRRVGHEGRDWTVRMLSIYSKEELKEFAKLNEDLASKLKPTKPTGPEPEPAATTDWNFSVPNPPQSEE